MAGDSSASSWFGKAVSSMTSPKQGILGMIDQAVAPNKEEIIQRLIGENPELVKNVDKAALSKIVETILKTLSMQKASETDVGTSEQTQK